MSIPLAFKITITSYFIIYSQYNDILPRETWKVVDVHVTTYPIREQKILTLTFVT